VPLLSQQSHIIRASIKNAPKQVREALEQRIKRRDNQPALHPRIEKLISMLSANYAYKMMKMEE